MSKRFITRACLGLAFATVATMPSYAQSVNKADSDAGPVISIHEQGGPVFLAQGGPPPDGMPPPPPQGHMGMFHGNSACCPPGPPPMGFPMGGPGGPPGFGHGPGGPGGPGEHLFGAALHMSGVELSDEQIEALAKVRRAAEQQTEPARAALHSLEENLKGELLADKIDEGKVKKLQGEIGAQHAQLAKAADDELLQSAQILTAEQRHKMRLSSDRMSLGPMGFKRPPPPPPAK